MTERRTPYMTNSQPAVTRTPLELRVQSLERELRIACAVIQAMLEREGRERCPNCGYQLKPDDDQDVFDNQREM